MWIDMKYATSFINHEPVFKKIRFLHLFFKTEKKHLIDKKM